jgi:hypothetical protein
MEFLRVIANLQVGQCGNQEAHAEIFPQAQEGSRHRCEG